MKQVTILFFLMLVLSGTSAVRPLPEKHPEAARAYLQFVNPEGDYPDGVEVYIDNAAAYIAMVTEDKDHSIRKDRWPVPAGHVSLRVVYEGAVVYRDSVLLIPLETRQIVLPKHNY